MKLFLSTAVMLLSILALNTVPDVTSLNVDTKASKLKWTGYHLAKSYEHYGYVGIKSGQLSIEHGELIGGKIIIDMNTITNEDVEGGKNAKLVKDLKSDRFFGVKQHPEASIEIKKSKKVSDETYNVTADIIIRGIRKEVQFPVKKTSNSGGKLEFTAQIEIDRIVHEVMHGWSIENAIMSNLFKIEATIVVNVK